MTVPTKWVTCDVAWGESKKHLYCPDRETLEFHKSHDEALAQARSQIESGGKMVAVFEIKNLFESRAEMVPIDLET